MVTAIDTSVILDFLCGEEAAATAAEVALTRALEDGRLIIGECVIGEVLPTLASDDLRDFLTDWQMMFVPSSLESSILAGKMYAQYLKRKGPRRRMLADFLIGAHAQTHADRLLARDRGYWRDYFSRLSVITP